MSTSQSQPTVPPVLGKILDDGCVELPSRGVSLQFNISPPRRHPQTTTTQPTAKTQNTGKKKRLAVCLHPWSWLGGRMNDPVLASLLHVLHEHEYHVLRYNSRGVGRSSGRSSFTGIEEGKDLEAIVQWAVKEIGGDDGVEIVTVIGYSHGSLIASLHPNLELPTKTAFVLLSYPLGPRSFLTLFKGSHYDQKLDELVMNTKSKVLVAFGGRDEFTSFDRYKTWAEQLKSKADSAAMEAQGDSSNKEVLRVLSVPEASHFWLDESNDQLCAELSSWLASL